MRSGPQISILIFTLQLLYSAAQWNPYSPLIQTQFAPQPKMFPRVVRQAHAGYVVYYSKDSNTPEVTYAMCPEPSYDPGSPTRQKYCNYGESFAASKYKRSYHRTECDYQVEPFMMAIEDKTSNGEYSHRQCGNGGHSYKFVYLRCEKKTRSKAITLFTRQPTHYEKMDEAHVYNACYHETDKLLLYGFFTIAAPHLLDNQLLRDEQSHQFPRQTDTDYNGLLHIFTDVAIPLYASNNQYAPRSVLPPELLPFALQRKPLFNYLNLAPMDVDLIDAWESLMLELKQKISQMDPFVRISAGLLNEVRLRDENGYIKHLGYYTPDGALPSYEIEIPHTWWVQVYDHGRKHGVVILMINELHNGNNMIFLQNPTCNQDTCRQANFLAAVMRVVHDYGRAMIYCCNPMAINEIYHFDGTDRLLTFPGEDVVVEPEGYAGTSGGGYGYEEEEEEGEGDYEEEGEEEEGNYEEQEEEEDDDDDDEGHPFL
ncbi:uncharacterized protein LOC135843935 [Planococcus citri]|uniref:uncharacterized protein LOC135843935 n=1 Tax=Planococcus citri TaxID=170843 RepID=UPI0031F82BD2